jgi:hypothetical protein
MMLRQTMQEAIRLRALAGEKQREHQASPP